MSKIYSAQLNFQKLIQKVKGGSLNELPADSIEWFKYHCLAMVEEMGELMKADKRWKTHRNERYIRDEKLDELSDVFITALNIAIYSGFSEDELSKAILCKINENSKRLEELK